MPDRNRGSTSAGAPSPFSATALSAECGQGLGDLAVEEVRTAHWCFPASYWPGTVRQVTPNRVHATGHDARAAPLDRGLGTLVAVQAVHRETRPGRHPQRRLFGVRRLRDTAGRAWSGALEALCAVLPE